MLSAPAVRLDLAKLKKETTNPETAKDALVGDSPVELILFSDLKSRANKYILELWQSEWDELPGNKLHEIFPVLKQCVVCPRKIEKKKL